MWPTSFSFALKVMNMNKKFLKYYMETESEGTEKNISFWWTIRILQSGKKISSLWKQGKKHPLMNTLNN